mmetsp:Transcript_54941/g.117920  ORF Transcript_54941/g.117920 Transcript_54941/m.117920 type:complete len:218 (+) Transcript_54941:451-1104(+)
MTDSPRFAQRGKKINISKKHFLWQPTKLMEVRTEYGSLLPPTFVASWTPPIADTQRATVTFAYHWIGSFSTLDDNSVAPANSPNLRTVTGARALGIGTRQIILCQDDAFGAVMGNMGFHSATHKSTFTMLLGFPSKICLDGIALRRYHNLGCIVMLLSLVNIICLEKTLDEIFCALTQLSTTHSCGTLEHIAFWLCHLIQDQALETIMHIRCLIDFE